MWFKHDLEMNVIKIHNSISDAARNVNIHKNNIWGGVIHNFRKTSGGFIFKYL